MTKEDILKRLTNYFKDSKIDVQDLTGSSNHYSILVIFSCLYSQIPMEYQLEKNNNLGRFENNSIKGTLANNMVIDIKYSSDSLYFIGTGNGLSYAEILLDETLGFGYFSIFNMPRGGNPALAVSQNIIAVSGVIDTVVATGTEPKGTGIAYSNDQGESWAYIPQPIDEIPLGGEYHLIPWGLMLEWVMTGRFRVLKLRTIHIY